ncbi:MAG: heavy metal translocating P-type ATPase [Saprospiraceae bacterium]
MANTIIKSLIPVLDMSCAACALSVENAVRAQPGVQKASVNYANENLQVDYNPDVVQPQMLRQAVQAAGYDLVLAENEPEKIQLTHHAAQLETLRKSVWGAGLLSIPVVLLGMIWMDEEWARWTSLFLSFPVVFGYGFRFFRNAWKQARLGATNMDTLVALSTGIAWFFSLFNTVFPAFFLRQGLAPHVYFEAAAVVVFFILLGKYLEENAKARTSSAIKKLMSKQPNTVWRREPGGDVERYLVEVEPGDVLLVRPGDAVPVDGKVVEGESLVDDSSISGEAVLQLKQTGARVFAGTLNQQGSFYLRAEQVGAHTLLARIIRTVQEAQGSKAPAQQLADRVAAIFVPTVLAIALIAFLTWWLTGHFSIGLLAGITVLVIACPCALGLATPTALMAGMGRAAEEGILVKNAASLEKARQITDMVLDKTGTITAARPAVQRQWWATNHSDNHRQVLHALESRSNHPLAAGVCDALAEFSAETNLNQVQNHSGQGISGQVQDNLYRAGSPDWFQTNHIVVPPEAAIFIKQEQSTGAGMVCFAENDQLLAVLALAAPVKPEARSALKDLQQRGITLHLLSGDAEQTVAHVAQSCGIAQYKGATLPHDKALYIQALQQQGKKVGMVGDGINDAEALALADIGIAMGHGADIAIDVADLTLLSSDLRKLPVALHLSVRTVRTIHQNLFWAFAYNLIGIPIAAGALYPAFGFMLNPMIAGAAMALSSVSVVGNSLRLRNAE